MPADASGDSSWAAQRLSETVDLSHPDDQPPRVTPKLDQEGRRQQCGEARRRLVRWTGVTIGLTVAAFVIAAGWMAWVVSQEPITITITVSPTPPSRPAWWAFQYAAVLLVALIVAIAALVT